MTTPRNTCAACACPIGIAFLMCSTHWRLVPRTLQTDVYRTWGDLTRRAPKSPTEKLARRDAYQAARDAAVNHARERITLQGAIDGHARKDPV